MAGGVGRAPAREVSTPRAVVLTLGRATAGESRRVESWQAILGAAGAEVDVERLLTDHRGGAASITRQIPGVLASRRVPETLAWSDASVGRRLRAARADLVVAITVRAIPTEMPDTARLVVDLVDPLSVNYTDRASLGIGAVGAVAYRVLAGFHRRVERRPLGTSTVRTAAGWSDARDLGVEWVPNVVDPPAPTADRGTPDHDAVFFGSLSYAPNVDAVLRLGDIWPAVLRRRNGARLVVAGRNPSAEVRAIVERHRWTLIPDFPSVAALASRALVAVAPLTRASGIQNKVLEAAAAGLPQVVSPAAVAGLRPGFPAEVAAPEDFADALIRLLEDAPRRDDLSAAARDEVGHHYVASAWGPWATQVLEHAGSPPSPPSPRGA